MNIPSHVNVRNCEIINSLYGTKIQILENTGFGMGDVPEDILIILKKNLDLSTIKSSQMQNADRLTELIANISKIAQELFHFHSLIGHDLVYLEDIVNNAIVSSTCVSIIPKLNGKMIPGSFMLDLESFSCDSRYLLESASGSFSRIISLNRYHWLCKEAMLALRDKNLFLVSKILYEFKCDLTNKDKFRRTIKSFTRNVNFELTPYFNDEFRYH